MVSFNLACSSLPVGSSDFFFTGKKKKKKRKEKKKIGGPNEYHSKKKSNSSHGIITQYLIHFSLEAFMCYVIDDLTFCRHPNPALQSKDKTNQKVSFSTFFKVLSMKMIGSQRWNAAITNRMKPFQSFIEQHTNVLNNVEAYHYEKCCKIFYRRQR